MAGRKKKDLDWDYDRECKRLQNSIVHAISQYQKMEIDIGPIAVLEAAKRCADLWMKLKELQAQETGEDKTQTVNHVINGFNIKDLDLGNNG